MARISLWGYGLREWRSLFTDRQLLALGTLVSHTRATRGAVLAVGYPTDWKEALRATSLVALIDWLTLQM